MVLKTRRISSRNGALSWNEDLIFVAVEPFENEKHTFSLETRHGKDTALVRSAGIELSSIEHRIDDRKVTSQWLNLSPSDEIKKRKRGSATR